MAAGSEKNTVCRLGVEAEEVFITVTAERAVIREKWQHKIKLPVKNDGRK